MVKHLIELLFIFQGLGLSTPYEIRLTQKEEAQLYITGTLEVEVNKTWHPVCWEGFDQVDAVYACRRLGYGAFALYYETSDPTVPPGRALKLRVSCDDWKKQKNCAFQNPGLEPKCPTHHAVGLICIESVSTLQKKHLHRARSRLSKTMKEDTPAAQTPENNMERPPEARTDETLTRPSGLTHSLKTRKGAKKWKYTSRLATRVLQPSITMVKPNRKATKPAVLQKLSSLQLNSTHENVSTTLADSQPSELHLSTNKTADRPKETNLTAFIKVSGGAALQQHLLSPEQAHVHQNPISTTARKHSSKSSGAIIGSVCAVVIILSVTCLLLVLWRHKKTHRNSNASKVGLAKRSSSGIALRTISENDVLQRIKDVMKEPTAVAMAADEKSKAATESGGSYTMENRLYFCERSTTCSSTEQSEDQGSSPEKGDTLASTEATTKRYIRRDMGRRGTASDISEGTEWQPNPRIKRCMNLGRNNSHRFRGHSITAETDHCHIMQDVIKVMNQEHDQFADSPPQSPHGNRQHIRRGKTTAQHQHDLIGIGYRRPTSRSITSIHQSLPSSMIPHGRNSAPPKMVLYDITTLLASKPHLASAVSEESGNDS